MPLLLWYTFYQEADSKVSLMIYDRNQVCEMLNDEGYELSIRTLRYWESKGQIPRSKRVGRKAVYDSKDIDRIRFMAATRPRAISKIRKDSKGKHTTSMEFVGNMLVLRISTRRNE